MVLTHLPKVTQLENGGTRTPTWVLRTLLIRSFLHVTNIVTNIVKECPLCTRPGRQREADPAWAPPRRGWEDTVRRLLNLPQPLSSPAFSPRDSERPGCRCERVSVCVCVWVVYVSVTVRLRCGPHCQTVQVAWPQGGGVEPWCSGTARDPWEKRATPTLSSAYHSGEWGQGIPKEI